MIIKAITLYIYRCRDMDCSNGGISSRYDTVLVEHPKGWIKLDSDNLPENFCVTKEKTVFGITFRYVEPYERPKHIGWMDGGCIVDTTDSRGRDVIGITPLRLHDRQETQELYDYLSC